MCVDACSWRGDWWKPRSQNRILTPATKTCRRGPRDLGHPHCGIVDLLLLLSYNLVLAFSGLVGDLQIILHAEDAGDGVGADERHFLVGLVLNHAIEFHVPV